MNDALKKMKLRIATGYYEVKAYSPQIKSLIESMAVLQGLGVEHDYFQVAGDSYVDRCKNSMVHEFLKTDFTHLMIIDSDETWDYVGFARLIKAAAMTGFEIVAGLYPCKNNWEFFGGVHKEKDGQVLGYEEGDIRLLEMEIAPGGFICYSREAFERTRPNLDIYVAPETGEEILEAFRCNIEFDIPRYTREELENMEHQQLVDAVLANQRGGRKGGRLGEDIYFQQRFKEMGGKIYCEPDIDMGHFGIKEWTGNYHQHLLKTRVFNQESQECELPSSIAASA